MVQVRVNEGILEGIEVENEYGGKIYKFKGIPYAEPPIGNLRFKAPQPNKPWDGVRSAKEHGSICYQQNVHNNTPPMGSEDCLYLNVYSPNLKPNASLPVMFFIHGGGFTFGSGNEEVYGPDFLVRHDVILVTINYRLEVLGFLCLDTEDIPGNAGMKDQVAALKWVKSNISYFGGNPKNITIFGNSAGGTSVTFHLVSPMTKGLFNRAIVQSGAATIYWSVLNKPRERAKALARKLGVESDDDQVLYEFFKSVPKESLVNACVPITIQEVNNDALNRHYPVVSEKQFGNNERFFYGDIYDVLRNDIHEGVQVISGYCRDDGFLLLSHDSEAVLNNYKNYLELFAPQEIAMKCPLQVTLEVGEKIKKFYFGKENLTMENLHGLVKPISMSRVFYSMVQWKKICSLKNESYFYVFSCTSERNVLSYSRPEVSRGKSMVSHSDEDHYLFPRRSMIPKINKDSETFQMVNNITTLWTNFAKFGNPTPDNSLGVQWQPYTGKEQNYLDIGPQLISDLNPNGEEIELYEDIMRQFNPHCLALNY